MISTIPSKLVNTQTINIDKITDISISYASDNIKIIPSDKQELVLLEYMNYDAEANQLAKIKIDAEKLNITSGERKLKTSFFSSSTIEARVELFVPSTYTGKLSVETSSGNISSEIDFNQTKFMASCKSGSMKLKNINAENIELSTSSGTISVNSMTGTVDVKASSGSINIGEIIGDGYLSTSSGSIFVDKISGHIDAQASSGSIEIKQARLDGKLKAGSGSIRIGIEELTGDIAINTSSGSSYVTMLEELSYNFSAETSSGSIKTYFDEYLLYNDKRNKTNGAIGENPVFNVKTQASSGSIHIIK